MWALPALRAFAPPVVAVLGTCAPVIGNALRPRQVGLVVQAALEPSLHLDHSGVVIVSAAVVRKVYVEQVGKRYPRQLHAVRPCVRHYLVQVARPNVLAQ